MAWWGRTERVAEAISRRASGRQVLRVKLALGVLQEAVADDFPRQFLEGTEAQDAEVEVVLLPARGRCRVCGGLSELDLPEGDCPACGGTLEVWSGEGVGLLSLELAPA